jgi:mandelate racemase
MPEGSATPEPATVTQEDPIMAPLTIRQVTARPVLAPLPRPLRTASGEIPAAPLLLLDVDTHQGVTGRAYVFGYTPATLQPLRAFVDNLAELLVGRPVAPADRADQLAAAFRLLGRQGLVGMALSGLDMALWDALGRHDGRPVVELLGGTARPLPAYDSFGVVDPVKDRELLEASVKAGFRAIKIKIGEGGEAEDADMVAGVREVIGPEVRLMVDLNQSQSAAGAIRRIQRLAGYDLTWVEEPVAAEDLAGHARVRRASPVPIQTGENWWFSWDMAHAIEAGACDLAMPDLMKIGGVTGWLRAMGLAEAASLPLSSHIFVEASAHVLAVSPTAHYLEYLDLAGAVLAEPLRPVDGTVTARGPGLGMDWDEDAVARYRYG